MVEHISFSSVLIALLPNHRGRITHHECIRLDVRMHNGEAAIYPIFQCTETLHERTYGCLAPDTTPAELTVLFPGIELEELDADEMNSSEPGTNREKAA